MERRTVREWQKAYEAGRFESPDRKTQIDAGWYDWFCKDTSLANKTKRMGQIVNQIIDGGKIDLDKMYVWFKNNCPVNGSLYDDFRFADLETGRVQFTIQLNCCWNKHRYTVFGKKNCFDEPLFETDSSKELVNWLNTDWEVELSLGEKLKLKAEGVQNPVIDKWLELYKLCDETKTSKKGMSYLVNYYINNLKWSEMQAVEYAIGLFKNGTVEQIKMIGKDGEEL